MRRWIVLAFLLMTFGVGVLRAQTNTNVGKLNASGNSNFGADVAIAGPRPYIDVTSSTYGALGNGSHDDGPAIQAAINASCATTLSNGHPDVFFPPGTYLYSRSSSANTPDFTVPCSGIRFLGGGQALGSASTTVYLTASSCPGSNAAPDFLVYNVSNVTFRNLTIFGCNESVFIEDSSTDYLTDMTLTAHPSSQADNTPLKITNSIEVKWIGGKDEGVQGSYILPTILFTDEVPSGIGEPDVSLVEVDHLWMSGGPIQYIKRQQQVVGTLQFTFNDDLLEGGQDFFQAISGTGASMAIGGLTFNNIDLSDSVANGATYAMLPAGGGYIESSGIEMTQPYAPYAIRMTDDTHALLGSYTINGCSQCGASVADQTNLATGVPTGLGTTQENSGGNDHISNYNNLYGIFDPIAATSLFTYQNPAPQQTIPYPADRWCLGGGICNMAADANFGFLFGDGTTNGFTAGFHSTAPNTLNVQFATVLPPTTFAGTATTGGTLAANSYYSSIWATTYASSPNCQGGGLQSTFAYAGPIVVGGSNDAINFSWVDPPAALSGTIQGYCIQIGTNGPGGYGGPGDFAYQYIYVSGAGTTTYAYTGQSQTAASPYIYPQSPMADFLQMSPTGIAPIGTATLSGCSYSTQLGGAVTGSFESGTSGSCTVTITPPGPPATNGWVCESTDLTTTADTVKQTAYTTTTATISGTTVTADLITFHCDPF